MNRFTDGTNGFIACMGKPGAVGLLHPVSNLIVSMLFVHAILKDDLVICTVRPINDQRLLVSIGHITGHCLEVFGYDCVLIITYLFRIRDNVVGFLLSTLCQLDLSKGLVRILLIGNIVNGIRHRILLHIVEVVEDVLIRTISCLEVNGVAGDSREITGLVTCIQLAGGFCVEGVGLAGVMLTFGGCGNLGGGSLDHVLDGIGNLNVGAPFCVDLYILGYHEVVNVDRNLFLEILVIVSPGNKVIVAVRGLLGDIMLIQQFTVRNSAQCFHKPAGCQCWSQPLP